MSSYSPRSAALRVGASLGALMVAYGLLLRGQDASYKSLWTWGLYLAVPVIGHLALRAADRQGMGSGYRRAFAVALLATVVASAMYSASVYAYSRFIDDSMLLEVREDLIESALAVRPGSGSEAEQRRRIEAFTEPGFYSIAAFLRLSAVGLVSSVVLAWRSGARGPA